MLTHCLVLALLAGTADAQEGSAATIGSVEEPDEHGEWVAVERATEAWVEPGGERGAPTEDAEIEDAHALVRKLAEAGVAVALSDRVITERTRVTVELGADERITVYEGTSVVIEDWGISHEIGAIFVQVSDAFRIQWGSTEAIVEGTEFAVQADADSLEVLVDEGQVRVRNELGETTVGVGEVARVPRAKAPGKRPMTPAERERWSGDPRTVSLGKAVAPEDAPAPPEGDGGEGGQPEEGGEGDPEPSPEDPSPGDVAPDAGGERKVSLPGGVREAKPTPSGTPAPVPSASGGAADEGGEEEQAEAPAAAGGPTPKKGPATAPSGDPPDEKTRAGVAPVPSTAGSEGGAAVVEPPVVAAAGGVDSGVGALIGVGFASQKEGPADYGGPRVRADLRGRFGLSGPVALTAGAGLLTGQATTQYPVSVGVGLGSGPVSAGAAALLAVGWREAPGGGVAGWLVRPGVAAEVDLWQPLGDAAALVVVGQGGWSSGIFVTASAGLGVRL